MTGRAVVLIGPMGAGKSSVGRKAARALGVPFYDSDAAVVRAHGPIEHIFTEHGEAQFRSLEREAVSSGLAQGGVVALGGGAVLDVQTQAALADHHVALLTVSPQTVASRLHHTTRPLLQDGDPMERWNAVYAQRVDIYERLADVTFDTSTGPLQAIVDGLVVWAQGQWNREEHP